MRRAPAVLILAALLGVVAYGASMLLRFSMDRLSSFSPGYLEGPGVGSGTTATSSRVVLLVIGGLTPADVTRLPTLEWLKRSGASWRVPISSPSVDEAILASMLTGMPTSRHGVFPPAPVRSLQGDHLLRVARSKNLQTAAVGSTVLLTQVQTALNRGGHPVTDPLDEKGLLDRLRPLLAAGGPELLLVELGPLLDARGAGDQGLATLDALMAQFADLLDLKGMTVLVTGTRPGRRSGQTGEIPFIMAGLGVRPGLYGEAQLVDVAPTAAALLGLPTPAQSHGRPLWESLSLSSAILDLQVEQAAQNRVAHAAAFARQAGYDVPMPSLPKDATTYPLFQREIEAAEQVALRHHWQRSLLDRAPYVGGGLFAALLVLLIILRQSFAPPLLGGFLIYVILFHGLFFTLGGRYGSSMATLYQAGFTTKLVGMMIASGLVAAAVTGLLLTLRGIRQPGYLGVTMMVGSLGHSAALGLVLGGLLIATSWDFPLLLPPAPWLVGYLTVLLHILAVTLGTPLWVLTAVTVNRLFAGLSPAPTPMRRPSSREQKVVKLRHDKGRTYK